MTDLEFKPGFLDSISNVQLAITIKGPAFSFTSPLNELIQQLIDTYISLLNRRLLFLSTLSQLISTWALAQEFGSGKDKEVNFRLVDVREQQADLD